MPFKPSPEEPDLSSLVVLLNNSKIQITNYALYQTILFLIQNLIKSKDQTTASIDTIDEGLSELINATFLTVDDETTDLPNSRQELAGTGITFDDSVAGQRTISATATGDDHVLLSDGAIISGGASPPNPIHDGFGNFVYIAYTP